METTAPCPPTDCVRGGILRYGNLGDRAPSWDAPWITRRRAFFARVYDSRQSPWSRVHPRCPAHGGPDIGADCPLSSILAAEAKVRVPPDPSLFIIHVMNWILEFLDDP